MQNIVVYLGQFFSCESADEIVEFEALAAERTSGTIVKTYLRCHKDSKSIEDICRVDFADADFIEFPTGTFALPCFYDAHIHAIASGIRQTKSIDLARCQSWEEAVQALRSRQVSANGWLVGGGWRRTWFKTEHPTAELLDAAIDSKLLVYLREKDGHCVWLNSAALGLLNSKYSDEMEKFQASGHIREGILYEEAANIAVKLLPHLLQQDYVAAIYHAQRRLIEKGIAGYQEAGLSEKEMKAYTALYHSAVLRHVFPRVRVLLRMRPKDDTGEIISNLQNAQLQHPSASSGGSGYLQIDGIKLFLDGVVEERTAALWKAYEPGLCCKNGGCHCKDGGELHWTDEDLKRVIDCAAGSIRTLHLHAIGDKAVSQAVKAAEWASTANQRDVRSRITAEAAAESGIMRTNGVEVQVAHVQLAGVEDLASMGRLGCRAVFSPLWFHEPELAARDILRVALGEERYAAQYPWQRLPPGLVCFGSDYPVTDFDPLKVLQAATAAGMPPAQALHAVTHGAAEACGWGRAGKLRTGWPADLVLLCGRPAALLPGLGLRAAPGAEESDRDGGLGWNGEVHAGTAGGWVDVGAKSPAAAAEGEGGGESDVAVVATILGGRCVYAALACPAAGQDFTVLPDDASAAAADGEAAPTAQRGPAAAAPPPRGLGGVREFGEAAMQAMLDEARTAAGAAGTAGGGGAAGGEAVGMDAGQVPGPVAAWELWGTGEGDSPFCECCGWRVRAGRRRTTR